MSRRTADRDEIAAVHLNELAEQLRELGVSVEAAASAPFPGLVAKVAGASAMIQAGSAHFWRKAPEGDIKLVGALDDPAAAARAVRKHLTDSRRHAHQRVKR